jgi:threonine dehydratase
MSDRSGSLARLTELIASRGASVIQAIHDPSEPRTMIDQTDMALTLETRGPDHSKALIRALRDHALKTELGN